MNRTINNIISTAINTVLSLTTLTEQASACIIGYDRCGVCRWNPRLRRWRKRCRRCCLRGCDWVWLNC